MSEYTIEQVRQDAEDLAYEIVQEAILTKVKNKMRTKPDPGYKWAIAVDSGMGSEFYFARMRELRRYLGGKKTKWAGGYIIYAKQVPEKFVLHYD